MEGSTCSSRTQISSTAKSATVARMPTKLERRKRKKREKNDITRPTLAVIHAGHGCETGSELDEGAI